MMSHKRISTEQFESDKIKLRNLNWRGFFSSEIKIIFVLTKHRHSLTFIMTLHTFGLKLITEYGFKRIFVSHEYFLYTSAVEAYEQIHPSLLFFFMFFKHRFWLSDVIERCNAEFMFSLYFD